MTDWRIAAGPQRVEDEARMDRWLRPPADDRPTLADECDRPGDDEECGSDE